MVRKVFTVTAVALLTLTCALGALLVYERAAQWLRERKSPYNQPGTVWTDSVAPLGYGTDLILLQDGTYAARSVCDICSPDDFSKGRWSEDAATVTLVPDADPKKRYSLIKERRNNCQLLRDITPSRASHPTFAKRSSRMCRDLLANELRARFEKDIGKAPGSRP